jgi:DNA helicase-2/ATP-dependent DNA helicase PcrA
MEKLKAAVNEFDHFQALMQKRNRYDFDDMINWVIKPLKKIQIYSSLTKKIFVYHGR